MLPLQHLVIEDGRKVLPMFKFFDLPDAMQRAYLIMKLAETSTDVYTDGERLYYHCNNLSGILAAQLCDVALGVSMKSIKTPEPNMKLLQVDLNVGSVKCYSGRAIKLCAFLHLTDCTHCVYIEGNSIRVIVHLTKAGIRVPFRDCINGLIGNGLESISFEFADIPNDLGNVSEYVSVSVSSDGNISMY